jgi:hypothetical protein
MNPTTGDDVFRYRLVLQYEDSQGVLEKIASSACLRSSIPPNTSSVEHILNAYQTIVEFLQSNFEGWLGWMGWNGWHRPREEGYLRI